MCNKNLFSKELDKIENNSNEENKKLFWERLYTASKLRIFFTRTSKDGTMVIEQVNALYNSPNLADVKSTIQYLVQIGSTLVPDMKNHNMHLGNIYISKRKYLSIWDLTNASEKWKS